MSNQSQARETKPKKETKPETKTRDETRSPLEQDSLYNDVGYSGGDGLIEGQTFRLMDQRLPNAQRQALAAQIGRVLGNQHLQHVISPARIDQNAATGKQSSSGQFAKIQLSPDVVEGEEIREVAGMPPGVHNARTALYYAQLRRSPAFFYLLYRNKSNRELIAEADRLNTFLLGPCERFGLEVQIEYARLLIDIEREMRRRLTEAPMREGLPVLEGITWTPGDPLAGTTGVIPPFTHYDDWAYIANQLLPEEEPPTQRRRRNRPTAHAYVEGSVPLQGFPLRQIVYLNGTRSRDPNNLPLTYEWTVVSPRIATNRWTMGPRDAERTPFRGYMAMNFALELVVTNSRGIRSQPFQLTVGYGEGARAPGERPPGPPPSREEVYNYFERTMRPHTFWSWFVQNRTAIFARNPPRVMGERSFLTFFHPNRIQLEELRQIYWNMENPTDETRYFARQRANLQSTINYWNARFERAGGESGGGENRWAFQGSDEYSRFIAIMTMGPPQVNIPMSGNPNYPWRRPPGEQILSGR